ncbi:MAG: G5 domain-containing protein [Anaerolineales bacterium]|nr:G5 domain-containing protein [Anaerolineales bacterium]
MKPKHALALSFAFFLFACQPAASKTITIIDGENIISLQTDERVPAAILSEAGITLDPNDAILLNGIPTSPELPITNYPITLQIRRVEDIQTPPPQPPTTNITITSNGKTITVDSSAQTVGEALAEAGIPLMGSDYSLPSEKEALPPDGKIKVVRVGESVLLAQKPIPFSSELIASAEVPLDQTQILQPGETGLTMQRIRVRYEDGVEVARFTEDETVVRPPKNRVLGYGTKIEIKTAVVDGVTIEYWRAVQMYVTSYSPCRSGGDQCYSGTSSGATVKKGVAGMRLDWYLAMGGQPLYIPGYGFATVEDVCGGCVGKPWIDVAYSDADFVPWSSWVTVYFLTPVPSNIVYVLE